MIAGLSKIILINSYIKGEILSEFNLKKHAQITGGNGAGKSSLLRLIPLFYGLEAGKVSKHSSVKKSFVDFYLPNNDSYIIYEYTTVASMTACVVISRQRANNSIQYRFVEGAFDPDLYIFKTTDDKFRAHSSHDLPQVLTSKSIEFTSIVSNNYQFKSIIQNTNRKSNSHEFAKFSLCGGRNNIRHVEKIIKSLVDNKFSVEDTKVLLTEVMGQVEQAVNITLDSSEVTDWVNDYNSVQGFLDRQDKINDVIENSDRLTQVESNVASTAYACELGLKSETAALSEAKDELEECRNQIEVSRTEKQSQTNEITAELESLKITAEQLAIEIRSIEKEQDRFLDIEAERKLGEYNSLQNLKDDLEKKRKRFSDLEEEIKDIESHYQQLIDKESISYEKHKSKLEKQHSASVEKRLTKLAEIEQNASAKLDAAKDAFNKSFNVLNSEKEKLASEIKLISFKITSVVAAPDLIQDVNIIEGEIQEVRATVEADLGTVVDLSTKISNLKTERSNSLERLAELSEAKKDTQVRIDKGLKLLNPENGSLLAYLEDNIVDWRDSFGKVLNEELLLRTDLNPAKNEDTNGIFGVSLELSNVKSTTQSVAAIEAELVTHYEQLEVLDGEIVQEKNDLSRKTSEIDKAEKELELLNSRVKSYTDKGHTLTKQLEAAKRRCENCISEAVNKYEKELATAKKSLTTLEKNIRESKDAHESEIQDIADSKLTALSDAETMYSEEASAVESSLDDLEGRYKATVKGIKSDKENKLSSSEIDQTVFAQYKESITTLESRIQEIEGFYSIAYEYKQWKETAPEVLESHRDKLSRANASIASLNEKQKEVDRRFLKLIKDTDTRRAELVQSTRSQEEQIKALKDILARAEELSIEPIETSEHKNKSLSLVISAANDQLASVQSLRHKRQKDLQGVQALLNKGGTASKISLFWEQSKERLQDEDGVVSEENLISVIKDILSTIAPQLKSALIAQAETTGGMLSNFKQQMIGFEKNIKSFSHKISTAIQSNIDFDIIEKIDVKLVSRLDKLKGWDDINRFTEAYEDWCQGDTTSLPSKHFGSALSSVALHLKNGRITGDICELFDISFVVVENGTKKEARTARDMENLASNGTNFLIHSVMYAALINIQRGAQRLNIHWPTDEIGKLAGSNIERLVGVLERNSLKVVAALPDPKPQVLELFGNGLHHIAEDGVYINTLPESELDKAIAAASQQ